MIPELCVTLQGAASGRIQWHVTVDPCITLLGAATWWIQSHDSRATCHIECHDRATLQGVRIPSAILKIVFRHIFLFLMQFGFWQATAFVSSPIRLLLLFAFDLWAIGPTRLRLIRWPCDLHLDLPIGRINCWWWCRLRHGFQMTFPLPSPLRNTGFRRFIIISHTVTDWFSWHAAKWLTMTRHWIKTLWERSGRHPDPNPD